VVSAYPISTNNNKGLKMPSKETIIADLKEIKKAIYANAADTLFMANSTKTVCEHIDGMLIGLGCDESDLEEENEDLARGI
jgi:hypothetical protein